MSPLSTKRRIKRLIYSKPVVIILVVCVLFMMKVTWSAYQRMAATGEEAAVVEQKQAELTQKRIKLEQKIAYLDTPQGIEEELRRKYSAAKEGERMVIILDSSPTSTEDSTQTPSFWKRAWEWLTPPYW